VTPAERPDTHLDLPAPDQAAVLKELLTSADGMEGHFDEVLDHTGTLRPHWQAFARHAGDLSVGDVSRQHARVERQIYENGVTYNVYATTSGPARPWAVDVLPAIIPAAEWAPLAEGLRQRARLLDAIAADLYGDQRLIAEGLVPPALVYGHRGFLRPCHGISPPAGVFLHLVAFDLAHGPDGRWWVVGTRAQAPSGAGYALENRLIISRLFPDAFRELRVHMVAQFFRALQETLLGSAPTNGEAPRVVLLTPGPYSETYFEHAYLARYLGFTLAEGGDLTVRDDRVHLKTLTGLKRVHVVLRRLDDDFCDPLELRGDSTLGVPGLVQAWRSGHVVVANALGTGVLDSAAWLAFLPSVCERLLGTPLAVPSVPTWWCGDAPAFDEASRDLTSMVIKPVFPDAPEEPVFATDLDARARAHWIERLRASPERYVLQRYLPLSHAPAWHEGRLDRRVLMLRVFLVADGRGDYHVMPGGLSRIAGRDRQVVSGQRGGSSKDTWVLSDAPIERFSLLPGRLRLDDIRKSQRTLSSRAGESLFWLGRYAERSENIARLLRAVLVRLPDADAFPARFHRPVIQACRRQGALPRVDEDDAGTPHRLERELISGMFDRQKSVSLAFNVEQTARVAGAVRDRLSLDNWRIVNQLFQTFSLPADDTPGLDEALDVIDRTIVSLVAVGGLETEHMTRDDGWRFLSIGRYMERLVSLAITVGEVAASGDHREPALLDWLLDLSDSTITYRARYMREPEWLAVSDLLLFDRRNPRSAAFQLAKLATQLRLLPEADLADLADLATETDTASATYRMAHGPDGDPVHQPEVVERLLHDWQGLAQRLSDALALRYFSHVYEPTLATWVI
jgi:uncharacterized circularly permuted ATP-grasp superfamily protein/uncharacterized alpha-E superfamily protein